MKDNQKIAITGLDVRIGLAVGISLLVCQIASLLGLQLQSLAACTGAVMCMQENGKASLKAGLNRLLGVVCGGVLGILVVLVQIKFANAYLFAALCCVAIILDLLLCKIVRLPYIAARVSCITFLLVVLVLSGTARISYALGRFWGTLAGAVVAMLLAFVWDALAGRKRNAAAKPGETAKPEAAVKPEEAAKPEEAVNPEDPVKLEEAVNPEEPVKP